MKNAVISVPMPGTSPAAKPAATQITSVPIRQKRNGYFVLLEMMMGTAS